MEFLWCLIGLLLGAITTRLANAKRRPDGVLKIDHSDPTKDLYRFEIDNLDDLSFKRRITIKVDNSTELSRE